MSNITRTMMMGSAGGELANPLYVDDLFNTYIYEGTSSNQTITNGIDFAGKGGMVWLKAISNQYDHFVYNTETGVNSGLRTNMSSSEVTSTDYFHSFNSDGYTVGSNGSTNYSGVNFCAWAFRQASGFFDVVKFEGNGVNGRQIAHSLGSAPGMIIIKSYDTDTYWPVYHRGMGEGSYNFLNDTARADVYDSYTSNSRYWNNTAPTSTHFTVSDDGWVNGNGRNYVAYVFAHNVPQFGTNRNESIITCGSYVGDATTSKVVTLGYEPQYLLLKNLDQAVPWVLFDSRRGVATNKGDGYVHPNDNSVNNEYDGVDFLPTGFMIKNNGSWQNALNDNYIYMAIRRPHKPPTVGTDVYQSIAYSGTSGDIKRSTNNLAVDMLLSQRTNGGVPYWFDNKRGGLQYISNQGASQEGTQTNAIYQFWNNRLNMGGGPTINQSSSNYLLNMFKRAPGFFDIVTYNGTNVARTVDHNLGVVPELIYVKSRGQNNAGYAYSAALGNSSYIMFSASEGPNNGAPIWNNTTPTSTQFSLGTSGWNVNDSAADPLGFVAYLFATLPGISKVGSYSGTGNAQTIDCGFTTGARFILIKRTDGSATSGNGDWYLFNSVLGINAGNEPYMYINSSNSQATGTDNIDPDNSGFAITSSAASNINANGGTFIFIAVA